MKIQKKKEQMKVVIEIAERVDRASGRALIVGGFARDEVLNKLGYDVEPKDLDIEVYGLDFDNLKILLQNLGELNIVGESFQVIKLKGFDISIPRRDSKIGRGHKGFAIEGDPTMTIDEAACRRDFTINALALDPLTGEIVDPQGDIENNSHQRAVESFRIGSGGGVR